MERSPAPGMDQTPELVLRDHADKTLDTKVSSHDDSKKLDTLVMSGGAVDALAFLGCIQYLEESRTRDDFEVVVGTSAGALLAFMFVLGYSATEMRTWAVKRFSESGANQLNIDDLLFSYDTMGVDNGGRMEAFMADVLYARLKVSDVSFLDLRQLTGGKRKLVVSASNLTTSRSEYFCEDTWPHLSVLTALRASSCVPYLFTPVKIGSAMFVDGGIFENLPLGACDMLGRHRSRVLAMNVWWEKPTKLPTDIVQYSWYLVSSILVRTNNPEKQKDDDDGVTLVHVHQHVGQCPRSENKPFMSFCMDTMQFVINEDTVQESIRQGHASIAEVMTTTNRRGPLSSDK